MLQVIPDFIFIIPDLIFVLIGVFIIWRTAKRGFLKSVLKFARFILAFIAASILGKPVSAFLYENFINQPVYDAVFKKVQEIYQSAAGEFSAQSVLNKLPGFLINEEMEQNLAQLEGTGEDLVVNLSQTIATPLASVISNVVAYALVFIVAFLVLILVIRLLDAIVNSIPLLNFANHLLGAAWGVIVAGVILFIAASIVKAFWSTADFYQQSTVIRFVGESGWLEAMHFLDIGKQFITTIFH
ncbi:MAG: CvpA family protein [Clostridia bacterium]|nr:CvpA family protein [Clostridia bacterium]